MDGNPYDRLTGRFVMPVDTLRAPASSVSPRARLAAEPVTDSPGTRADRSLTGRIVVADGNPYLRRLIQGQLEATGLHTIGVDDSAELIDVCRTTEVDLVLLDLDDRRPGGLATLQALKEDPVTEQLPVLLMTAELSMDTVRTGFDLGAHDYLRKPFEVGDLHARVEAALHVSRRTRQLRENEERLADSVRRYRAVLDHLPGGAVITLDRELRIRAAGGAMLTDAGYDTDGIVGKTVVDVVPLQDAEFLMPYFRVALAGRRTGSFPFVAASGTESIVDMVPLSDAAGEVVEILCSIRDVTQLHRTEAALRHAEERFRSGFESAPLGVMMTDTMGVISQVNPALQIIIGLAPDHLIGTQFAELLEPGQEAVRKSFEVGLERGQGPVSGTLRLRRPDGETRWVNVTSAPLYDDSGARVGIVSHVEDVSDPKIIEDALADERARYRASFHAAPVGMAQLSRDGSIENANTAFAQLVGRGRVEMLGHQVTDYCHREDIRTTLDAIEAMARGERAEHRDEIRVRHEDGHIRWVAMSAVPVFARDGSVAHLLAHFLDISDSKRFEADLKHAADHDPLTGLLNRRAFEVALERQVGLVSRYGPQGALLLLDLDHFKQVNDTLGHKAGDELIVAVAGVLSESMRDTDVIARLGGDEFAVIVPFADRKAAENVAEKLLVQIGDFIATLSGEHHRRITTSIGIALFEEPSVTSEAMLINADLAMYDAKEAGRNRYAIHLSSSDHQTQTRNRLEWVDRIRDALALDRFTLYAQPVLDLRTNTINRYEVLLRMLDDEGTPVPPASFLGIAERVGLIGAIDRWVTGRTIEMLADPRLPEDIVLEVNISALSLGDHALLDLVRERLIATGVDPRRLIFEITETAAIANLAAAQSFAEELANLGCGFALDDFGAGFGSFYYLKHLPFDVIKIDGEFVEHCLHSATDRLIIQSLVTVAKGLAKHTVAEFVSDHETAVFLAERGVDFAQGYHVGRAEPFESVVARHSEVPSGSVGQ